MTLTGNISDYEIKELIGVGSYGKVKKALHIPTQQMVAMKIIKKSEYHLKKKEFQQLQREIQILQTLNHPHIIKLFDVIETKRTWVIVTEYSDGGELFDYLVQNKKLKESVARKFFRQLLQGISYCHFSNIIHRDLKLENLLLDKNLNLKIIDFGLSNFERKDQLLKTFCGSPSYSAPEILRRQQYSGFKSDVWSMGVILYLMVVGSPPFFSMNARDLFQKIVTGSYILPNYLPEGLKDLIPRMLSVDPANRISIKEILTHEWVVEGKGRIENQEIETQCVDSMIDPLIVLKITELGDNFETIMIDLDNNKNSKYRATYNIYLKMSKESSNEMKKSVFSFVSKKSKTNQKKKKKKTKTKKKRKKKIKIKRLFSPRSPRNPRNYFSPRSPRSSRSDRSHRIPRNPKRKKSPKSPKSSKSPKSPRNYLRNNIKNFKKYQLIKKIKSDKICDLDNNIDNIENNIDNSMESNKLKKENFKNNSLIEKKQPFENNNNLELQFKKTKEKKSRNSNYENVEIKPFLFINKNKNKNKKLSRKYCTKESERGFINKNNNKEITKNIKEDSFKSDNEITLIPYDEELQLIFTKENTLNCLPTEILQKKLQIKENKTIKRYKKNKERKKKRKNKFSLKLKLDLGVKNNFKSNKIEKKENINGINLGKKKKKNTKKKKKGKNLKKDGNMHHERGQEGGQGKKRQANGKSKGKNKLKTSKSVNQFGKLHKKFFDQKETEQNNNKKKSKMKRDLTISSFLRFNHRNSTKQDNNTGSKSSSPPSPQFDDEGDEMNQFRGPLKPDLITTKSPKFLLKVCQKVLNNLQIKWKHRSKYSLECIISKEDHFKQKYLEFDKSFENQLNYFDTGDDDDDDEDEDQNKNENRNVEFEDDDDDDDDDDGHNIDFLIEVIKIPNLNNVITVRFNRIQSSMRTYAEYYDLITEKITKKLNH
ncbi:kp78a-related [Anaeramoeba flamelloides]|uniref:Kp78a-related n=1 Tax=Anaeramoeba flamelloides TaxID=1746091 RepID=A0ABQ8XY80_9EUKA|nr:kp78a-related [Anaeramoeba flamelloides]